MKIGINIVDSKYYINKFVLKIFNPKLICLKFCSHEIFLF